MLDDADRTVADFLEHRLRTGKEQKVRIDVGQAIDIGMCVQKVKRQIRCEREVILGDASIASRDHEIRVGTLDVDQTIELDVSESDRCAVSRNRHRSGTGCVRSLREDGV